MMPPHWHMSMESLVRAGLPPINSFGLPGIQGPAIIGIHGMGVSTPKAAAVALATFGLARLLHIPNGIIFITEMLSMMDARAWELMTLAPGRTFNTDGAAPNEQVMDAPAQTQHGIYISSYINFSLYGISALYGIYPAGPAYPDNPVYSKTF